MATIPNSEPAATTGTILLVEDSTVERLAVAALLEDRGYEVHVAAEGEEALHLLQASRRPVDLVLTDIGMPRMNGITLCRNLKRNAMTKHIPVIMLTSFVDERNHRTAVEAGAADFVTKPVAERELLFRVESVLSSSREEGGLEANWHTEVFEALADAIIVTDDRDHLIDANPAAYALLGYARDDLLNTDVTTLTPSPDWLAARRLNVKQGEPWRGRGQFRHKSGGSVLVEARVSSTSFDGELVYVSVLRDVV